MSFRFIEDHRDAYPVRLMCAVLEVSPAGYYAWRDRPVSERTKSNATLLAAIRQVHQDSSGRYGSPRVHAVLHRQCRGASRGRIERMMRRHGIRAIMAPPRRVRTTDSRHDLPIAPNLIARDFTAKAPNRVWLADTPTSRPRRGGCIWQPSWISSAERSSAGRCGIICRSNSHPRP
jgi:putative transposase